MFNNIKKESICLSDIWNMDNKEEYIIKSQLKERGWTDTMVKRFLGAPDKTKVNPFYKCAAPMGLYDIKRVKKAERTKSFKDALEKSVARKVAAEKAVATKTAKERLRTYERMSKAWEVECCFGDIEINKEIKINYLCEKLRKMMSKKYVHSEPQLKRFLYTLSNMNNMLAKGYGVWRSFSDDKGYRLKQRCVDFIIKQRPDRCFYDIDLSMYVVYIYAGGRQYSFHCNTLAVHPRIAPDFGVRWDGLVEGFTLSDDEYKEKMARKRKESGSLIPDRKTREEYLRIRKMLLDGGNRIRIYMQRREKFLRLAEANDVRCTYRNGIRFFPHKLGVPEYTQFSYIYGFDVFPDKKLEESLQEIGFGVIHCAITRFYGLNEANYKH